MNLRKTLASCFLVAATPLIARASCSHPGTPNSMSVVPSAGYVTIWFNNGASEGDHTDLFFDVEATEPPGYYTTSPIPHKTTTLKFGKIPYHAQGSITIYKLTPQTQYCFRLWVRDDSATGCRSEQPTAPQCVTTLKLGPNLPPVLTGYSKIAPYNTYLDTDEYPYPPKNGFN